MRKTSNYNLSLYDKTDKMTITAEEDSLNHNMELIDSALKEVADNSGGGSSDIVYIELNKAISTNTTFNRNDSATIDLETKFNEFTSKYKKIPMIYIKDYNYSTQHLYTIYSASSSGLTFLQMGETSINSSNSIYHNASTLTISGTYNTQTLQISITSFNVTPCFIFQYLARNNTERYTPTANYHPATKKYVDDAIASAIASLTNNNN